MGMICPTRAALYRNDAVPLPAGADIGRRAPPGVIGERRITAIFAKRLLYSVMPVRRAPRRGNRSGISSGIAGIRPKSDTATKTPMRMRFR